MKDERSADEALPAADTDVVAEEERKRELEETARHLSVANDLDTGPPRHD